MKKTYGRGFLILNGSCFPDGVVNLKPAYLMPALEPPYYGKHLVEEINIVGKTKDGTVLFKRHPYERVIAERTPEDVNARHFVLAVEYMPELYSIALFYRDKLVKTMDQGKEATVEVKVKANAKQAVLTFNGMYSSLTIIARDPESDNWTHVYLDDAPNEGVTKTIEVPWSHFPPVPHVIIEAVAMRGIHMAKCCTDQIEIDIQPVQLHLNIAGFRVLQNKKKPKYQFIFAAKGYLHGQSIPASVYQWRILGKTYRGQYITMEREGRRRFKVEVAVTDIMDKRVISEMLVDPILLEKEREQNPRTP
jgi:hypothetical protein